MDNRAKLNEVLADYLPQVQLPRRQTRGQTTSGPWNIVLTGSTGSLGTRILATLQNSSPAQVRKIYCLNRREDAERKQAEAFSLCGLPLRNERTYYLKVTIGLPNFGLSEQTLERLMDDATIIIHNAWPVNFLMPLEAFRPHIRGVRDFLHFVYKSPNPPIFLYISSLGVAYASDIALISEEIYHDFSAMVGGYSQSKYIAERMVETFVCSTGIPAAVLRVGQIAGPVHSGGLWPHREWFPTLLRASRHIDALPTTLGRRNAIDWIPVDIVSEIVAEIAEYVVSVAGLPIARAVLVFNIANPATVPFGTLLPHMSDITTNTVTPEEWLNRLRRTNFETVRSPGAKLLAFYEAMFSVDKPPIKTITRNLISASKTSRSLHPVSYQWVSQWLDRWGYRAPQAAAKL